VAVEASDYRARARIACRVAVLAIAAFASACGSSRGASKIVSQPITRAPHARVAAGTDSVTIHLGGGRQLVEARLHEPAGVILLYRLRAPFGTTLQGTTQLPSVSAPLYIRTAKSGPSSSCDTRGSKVVCTVGEEWCPMPAGVWHVRVNKYSGPPGDVTIWFRVGEPPAKYS
jgi:hypothetical protein